MDDVTRRAQAMCTQASGAVDLLERKVVGTSIGETQKLVDAANDFIKANLQVVESTGAAASRSFSQLRLGQLREECDALQGVLDRMRKQQQKAEEAQGHRDLLLAGNRGGMARLGGLADGSAESIRHLAEEEKSLQYSRRQVQRVTEESHAVLAALRSQRQRMERSNSRVGQLMESLGVGNETILQIARRHKADSVLVYCGIAVLFLLMCYLWFA